MDLTIMVPVVIALTEAIKMTGLSSRWSPFVSIILGVIGFYFLGEGAIVDNVFQGVVAGLSAAGLYSGVMRQIR